ncbi:alkaline phosphatase D family protein [Hyphococcus flavus]|uniref:Alkaline phosphatase D family protein n=1 Tax=Hyphococcus flavus TaxID=1866326 RepID=A0AAE9ZEJ9_9PROT|nr:alkaline phosphatase D family protein [Hyphococcus flavus]WDI32315.1 alkaline phosphatase D family protein [Hyphococcus flavus]
MTANITRRGALLSGLAVGATSCASSPKMTPYIAVSERAGGTFSHGVASGDPGADSVVIWSRIDPIAADTSQPVIVVWETAADQAFTDMRGKGEAETMASRDWTVKVLLTDLQPGETIYYRFRLGEEYSPVGRTRTLPIGAVDAARFAVMSCSNYPFGYFNVYDLVAREDDLDAIIHLGDYIYEYSREGYGGEAGVALGRNHEPPHEIVSLDDYRKRHAQYKADPSSQAMHARHPIIPIWDDHETSNNSWKGGAENHQPETEGEWNARRRAALQAYYEWMPVREPGMQPEAFFRSFSYGDLMTIAAIETRLMARARQFEYSEIIPTLETPEDVERFKQDILWEQTREMLGAAQIDYLDRTFRNSIASGQPWRLIANQIIMAKVTAPDLTPHVTEEDIAALEQQWDQARAFVKSSTLGLPTNFDAWDGYPAARERFYEMTKNAGEDGMIVVTGDTHTWWANDLVDHHGDHRGVELGTHSVTSPSPYRKDFLGGKGAEYALLTNRDNEDVRYLSGEHHGFIHLTVTKESARAEFRAVDTIESGNYNGFTKVAFDIEKKKGSAKFSDADGLGFKEGFLF